MNDSDGSHSCRVNNEPEDPFPRQSTRRLAHRKALNIAR